MTTHPASRTAQTLEASPFHYLLPVLQKYEINYEFLSFLPAPFFPHKDSFTEIERVEGKYFSQIFRFKTASASKYVIPINGNTPDFTVRMTLKVW